MANVSGRFVKIPYSILGDSRIGAAAKLVWGVLANRQGDAENCWPSVRKLARELALSVNAVRRGLAELEKVQLVEIARMKCERNRYAVREPVSETDTGVSETNTDSGSNLYPKRTQPCIRNGYTPVSETDTQYYNHVLQPGITPQPPNPLSPQAGTGGKGTNASRKERKAERDARLLAETVVRLRGQLPDDQERR